MKYRFLTQILLSFVFAGFAVSCNDELISGDSFFEEKELSEVKLCVDVAQMATYSQSRAEESITNEEKYGSEEERKIEDIWLFQFNAAGDALLCEPRYYPIAGSYDISEKGIEVLLALDVESIIYVVANVHNSSWATSANSKTLADVKNRTLPINNTEPFKVIPGNKLSASIPMEGEIKTTLSFSGGETATVTVPVTRMFAKLEITLNDVPETLKITDLDIQNIPSICRIGTLWDTTGEGTTRAKYPEGTDWTSNAFKAGDKDENDKYPDKYVIYIPENLQGQNSNTDNQADSKTSTRLENSIVINFHAIPIDPFTKKEYGTTRIYSFCPGANEFNDYNIRRNYIYKIRLHLYTDKYEQETPSSNCFVIRPGQRLNFLPYYRIEKGGGYNFEDYLDPSGNDPDKMIDKVSIIWQTPDAIGDNSKGDLVSIDPAPDPDDPERAKKERARKIYVQAGSKIGNALIAGYNKKGDIVWSWHIWVADHDPANVSSAAVYTTYGWDEKGIYTNARVPGYAIMDCNLGALANEPTQNLIEDEAQYNISTTPNGYQASRATFGMLYQWGRKDPFPPIRRLNGQSDEQLYTKDYVISLRDNSNKDNITFSTAFNDPNNTVFQNAHAAEISNGIEYTINNPTHFMVTTSSPGKGTSSIGSYDSNKGDWLNTHHKHDLWGGLDPEKSNKSFEIPGTNKRFHLYDNYGSEKTIFDPCPSGWRVPPGDLWLGFTRTGLNPKSKEEINYREVGTTDAGMYLFLTAWKNENGKVSYFPAQGLRVGNGGVMRSGSCGNYHNATTDLDNQVNILHIHNSSGLFKIFELSFTVYTRKSVGGPIRCVRDHK